MSRIKPSMAGVVLGVGFSVALAFGTGRATITSMTPPSGSTLTGSSQTFSWTGTANILEYWEWVGSIPGGFDILDSGTLGTSTSLLVNDLPTDGSTVHVSLWHKENGTWLNSHFSYTAFMAGGGGELSAVPPWSKLLGCPTQTNCPRFEVLTKPIPVFPGFKAWGVLDHQTGLVWEHAPGDQNGDGRVTVTEDKRVWGRTLVGCADKTVGDQKGWRLPSVHELASLVDPNQTQPALPNGHPFSNVQSSVYWSATTLSKDPAVAFFVNFHSSRVNADFKTDKGFVWCVRGGGPLSVY